MAKITVEFEDSELDAALARAVDAGAEPAALFKAFGEVLTESTKKRFDTSRAPDGTPWAPVSELTEVRLLARHKSNWRKDGGLTKKGMTRLLTNKPLVGETRALSSTIAYQLESPWSVAVGSPMVYGPTHQFGAEQGEFGRTKRNGPIPWGDIPARPYLGLSREDEAALQSTLAEWITASWS